MALHTVEEAAQTSEDQKKVEDFTKQIKSLTDERAKILRDFGGLTSNIPISNGYWSMGNQIQNLIELRKYAEANLAEDKAKEAANKKGDK